MSRAELIHATSVAIDGRAMLLSGPSGSGKSDLALRLIDRGALLISDDYTLLESRDGALYASAPAEIAGKIEIRGIGIEQLAFAPGAAVALQLLLDAEPDRMPADIAETRLIAGHHIPTMPLLPFEATAAIKAELALRRYGLKVMTP